MTMTRGTKANEIAEAISFLPSGAIAEQAHVVNVYVSRGSFDAAAPAAVAVPDAGTVGLSPPVVSVAMHRAAAPSGVQRLLAADVLVPAFARAVTAFRQHFQRAALSLLGEGFVAGEAAEFQCTTLPVRVCVTDLPPALRGRDVRASIRVSCAPGEHSASHRGRLVARGTEAAASPMIVTWIDVQRFATDFAIVVPTLLTAPTTAKASPVLAPRVTRGHFKSARASLARQRYFRGRLWGSLIAHRGLISSVSCGRPFQRRARLIVPAGGA